MNNKTKLIILRALYLFFGTFGIAFCFIETFHISIYIPALILSLLIYVVMFSYIFSKSRRTKYFLPIVTLLCIIITYLHRNSVLIGFKEILNAIINQYNQYFNAQVYLFDINAVSKKETLYCILVIMFFVSGMIGIAILRIKSALACMVIYTPCIAMALILGLVPPAIPLFFLIFSILGVSIIGKRKRKNKYSKYVTSVIHSDLDKDNVAYKLQMTFVMWVMTGIVTGIAWFAFLPKAHSYFDQERHIANDIQKLLWSENVEDFFQKFNNWKLFNYADVGNSGMSGGVLGNVSAIKDTNRKDLNVNFSQSIKGRIYLKGYVGSIYTSNRWLQLDDSKLQMLEEMGGKNLFQLTSDILDDVGAYKQIKVIVDRVNANGGYVYIPYNTKLPDNTDNRVAEAYIAKNKNRRFEFDFYPYKNDTLLNLLNTSQQGMENMARTPLTALENGYQSFVYQNYMQLPESEIDSLREIIGNVDRHDFNTLYDCITYVQNLLKNAAVYSKSPGSTPENKDFVTYFLTEQKQGYCMHFASAGTLLFRLLGIPARYVEGYTVVDPSARTNISIPDSSAHAWPEIYVNGYGWIPIEVTPGFADSRFDFTDPLDSLDAPIIMPSSSDQEISSDSTQLNHTDTKGETEREIIENRSEDKEEIKNVYYNGLWFILIAILLSIVLTFIRYIYLSKKRFQMFYDSTPKSSIVVVFDYIRKLSKFVGYPLDEYTNPQIVEKEFPYITSNQYQLLVDLLYESRFSNHKISKEQQDEVILLYNNLVKGLQKEMNGWEKFLCHFIYCFW